MRRLLLVAVSASCVLPFTAGTASANWRTDLVESWYARYLHRHPDPLGMHSHAHALSAGTPALNVEAAILASPEYYHRHGCSPEGFITGLYADVLGHRPSMHELHYWMTRLAQCGCRLTLACAFLSDYRLGPAAPIALDGIVPVYRSAFHPSANPAYSPSAFGLSVRVGR